MPQTDQTMSKQRRYSSEAEILECIDKAKEQACRFYKSADDLEKRSKIHLEMVRILESKNSPEPELGTIAAHRVQAQMDISLAEKRRRRASSVINVKLSKLTKVLAAFRTEPMMAITGTDVSVVEDS